MALSEADDSTGGRGPVAPRPADGLTFAAGRTRIHVALGQPSVVAVSGELDGDAAPVLRRALDVAVGRLGDRDVEIDLGPASPGDAGVEALRRAGERLGDAGRRLTIRATSPAVQAAVAVRSTTTTGDAPAGRLGSPGEAADEVALARARSKAPSSTLAALEQRAVYEFLAFMASSPALYLMRRGDGHPVMVLPPFAVDDAYTAPLRWVLSGQGYAVHGWEQGTNLSRTPKICEGLPRRLLELHDRYGARISLVGHSGGGSWARDLARRFPSAVRQVITLGSPFRLRPGDATGADGIAELLLREQVPQDDEALLPEEDRPPLTVPVTAIYTRTDGVAPWHAGIEAEGPRRENIEVVGSHCGLGYNPAAVIAVADRLAQPEGHWQPFEPPPFSRHLFPPPVYWRPPAARRAAA